MTRWDENGMLSIYPGVSGIYTLRRTFHLSHPCISVHPPLLLNDNLGGHDRASFVMQLETEIEWTQRCTGRLWSSEIGWVLGGGGFEGRRDGSWYSIHWLTCNFGNVESWVQHLPRDEKLAGSGWLLILGWYCTWCMLYLVLTHDYGMER